MIGLVKCAQISFFQNMLLGRLHIDSFWIVDRSIGVADADDFDPAFVSKRKGRDCADVSESLQVGGALFGSDFQHVWRAPDQINDAAAGRFASAFRPAEGTRFAGSAVSHGLSLGA